MVPSVVRVLEALRVEEKAALALELRLGEGLIRSLALPESLALNVGEALKLAL